LSGFVASARDVDAMLVLGGCGGACARKNLKQVDITARNHFIMTELGVKKEHDKAPTARQTAKVKAAILDALPDKGKTVLPLASQGAVQ
jgi:uncharacterized metal-binding protein